MNILEVINAINKEFNINLIKDENKDDAIYFIKNNNINKIFYVREYINKTYVNFEMKLLDLNMAFSCSFYIEKNKDLLLFYNKIKTIEKINKLVRIGVFE